MKILIFLTIGTLTLFANYDYSNPKMGKIDMHGGKKNSLFNKNKFSSPNFTSLSDIKIAKPKAPKEPKNLIIEKIKKDKKKGN